MRHNEANQKKPLWMHDSDPINDPNSNHHRVIAMRLCSKVSQRLGKYAYNVWVLSVFKPNHTWLDVELAAQEALDYPDNLHATNIVELQTDLTIGME